MEDWWVKKSQKIEKHDFRLDACNRKAATIVIRPNWAQSTVG